MPLECLIDNIRQGERYYRIWFASTLWGINKSIPERLTLAETVLQANVLDNIVIKNSFAKYSEIYFW